jgi:enoyl-CoA hydratase/carnithine racemase
MNARLLQFDADTATDMQKAVLQEILNGPRGNLDGPFLGWIFSPELAQSAQRLGAFCRYNTGLPLRLSETAIGFFPDVGASYFLARMPVELGLYLGITGTAVNFSDALFAGLAHIAVTSERLANIESLLHDISWSGDPLSDIRTAITAGSGIRAGSPPLETLMLAIRRHFDPSLSIAQMIESLDGETDMRYCEWAADTATKLCSRSPLMMCVTREQLLRGRTLSLAECFRMELGIAVRACEDGDFIEGIRALLIDKDNAPQWRPTTPDHVTMAMTDRFFDSPWNHSDHPLQNLA